MIAQLDPLGYFTATDPVFRPQIGRLFGEFRASERREQREKRVDESYHRRREPIVNTAKMGVARYFYPAQPQVSCGDFVSNSRIV